MAVRNSMACIQGISSSCKNPQEHFFLDISTAYLLLVPVVNKRDFLKRDLMFLNNLQILIKSRLPKCTSLSANMGSSWSALAGLGSNTLVDFGSARVVTYGAFFSKFLCVTYPVAMLYPAKKFFFVLYRAISF